MTCRFKDVAGLEEEKEDLEEVVDLLKESTEVYKSRGPNAKGGHS